MAATYPSDGAPRSSPIRACRTRRRTLGAFDVTDGERRRIYEDGWAEGGIGSLSGQFSDVFTSADANFTAQEFAREKIREIVHDPAVAELLCPSHYIGMRRTCVDIDYFETYNRDNVELIDVRRTPITRILPRGIATAEAEYEVDVIVFAIGFDAMTGGAARHRCPRRRRPVAAREVGARAADVPRPGDRGLPEPVRDHGARQPGRALEHGVVDRAARRLDRRLPRLSAGQRARPHRGDGRGRGRLGGARQRAGRRDALHRVELVVHRLEHRGQTARVHAVRGRLRALPGHVRHGRRGGVRGVHACCRCRSAR